MSPSGYTIEITNLSPNATKKDIYDFLAFCGAIQHVEIIRAGEYACKAYVTFKNPHAVDTAVILDGFTILDQPVRITKCNPSPFKFEDEICSRNSKGEKVIPPAGKAVSLAQDVVKTMAAKGKDALCKAKAFDESHQVSKTAVSNFTKLSEGIGLTNKISAGVEAAKFIDQRYCISGTTKSTAISAANTVVNSSYFSKGALWLSGALNRASRVAADLSTRGVSK